MNRARTLTFLTAAMLAGAGPLTFAQQTTPPPAQQAPPAADAKPSGKATVSGKWTMTLELENQPPAALDVKLTDKKVSGALTSPSGEVPIAGDYTDGKLTFSITVQSSQGQFTIAFTGGLKDDDTMTGTMDFGQGSVNWKAVRVKDGK